MKRTEKKYYLTESDERLVAVTTYDALNRVTEEILYDEMGNLNSAHELFYDEKGRLVKELIRDEFNDEALPVEIDYDNEGRVTEKRKYYADGTFEKDQYSYKDNIKIVLATDADGEFIAKMTFEYDQQEHLLKESEYNMDDEPISSTENFYNTNGKVERAVYENKYEEIKAEQLYVYDDQDRLITVTEKNLISGKMVSKVIWVYDGDKLVKEEHYNYNGFPDYVEKIYRYADNGLEEQITVQDASGGIFSDVLYIKNEKGHVINERSVGNNGSAKYGSFQSALTEFKIDINYLD